MSAPSIYTYEWSRDGTTIAGATSNTYTVQAADAGHQLTCLVTGVNSAGSTPVLTAAVAVAATAGGAATIVESTDTVVLAAGGTQAVPDVLSFTLHAYTFGAGNVTFTFPAPVPGKSFTMALTQDTVGDRSAAWPSSARWAGGLPPTLTTIAGQTDYLSFLCSDGIHFDGFVAGANY